MQKQQVMTSSQKYARLPGWKCLLLTASMLLSGGSLALFVPSQAVFAYANWPLGTFICRAGDGGSGGSANNASNGAAGGPGGDCVNGIKGSVGAPGGDHNSPGGNVGFP